MAKTTVTPKRKPVSTAQVKPAVTSSWYELYFTEPQFPYDAGADHPPSLGEALAAFIDTADQSVLMAVYQLDLDRVVEALIRAHKREVEVRVVTDIGILDDRRENEAFKKLEKIGIPVKGGNTGAIMHNKFAVVDDEAVWTGSCNFTENDTYKYNNHGIIIRSSHLAWNYTIIFEKMFREKQYGGRRHSWGTRPDLTIEGHTIESYFSPEDEILANILPRLEGAEKSVHFMAFSFTHDDMGDLLKSLSKQGIEIHGVFETTGSQTKYSEYGRLRRARPPVDVLQDGNPYPMHHKVFIIDGETVILGSFNFSKNAEKSNDENLLIIDDETLAGKFTEEFARICQQAQEAAEE